MLKNNISRSVQYLILHSFNATRLARAYRVGIEHHELDEVRGPIMAVVVAVDLEESFLQCDEGLGSCAAQPDEQGFSNLRFCHDLCFMPSQIAKSWTCLRGY